MIFPQKTTTNLLSETKHNISVKPPFSNKLYERFRNEKLLSNKNYFLYLFSLLQKTQLYLLLRRSVDFFRKFKLVSLLFRIYSYLLVLLQVSTALFFIVLGVLLLIPVLLISGGCLVFSALLLYRKENKRMKKSLDGKTIIVFFPTRDGEFERGCFWKTHTQEVAKKPNTVVLIVSPFFWSGKGLNNRHFYPLIRKENENLYILRKHYYFSLKQNILKNKHSLILIY